MNSVKTGLRSRKHELVDILLRLVLVGIYCSFVTFTGCYLGQDLAVPNFDDDDDNDDNDNDDNNDDDNDDNDAIAGDADSDSEPENDSDSQSDSDSESDTDSQSDTDTDTETETDTGSDTDTDTCPDMSTETGATRILQNNHSNWNNPRCLTSGCHQCGADGVTVGAECGYCHGGNGAENVQCKQGNQSNCGSCHNPMHGTSGICSTTQQCNYCHSKW